MHPWLQHPDSLLFESISELILNNDITFAFGYKVYLIIFFGKVFILSTKNSLWRFKHCVHSLDNVVDHLVVIGRAI